MLIENLLRPSWAVETLITHGSTFGEQAIRIGLLDLGPATERVSEEVRLEVVHRFSESLEKHIDLPASEFNRWFFDALDNLVKQISERKREIGPVDRQAVRQVILEQCFESYAHLAGLVEGQMRAFAHALQEPLTAEESSLFVALYDRQRWLGGLSVAMLAEQFPLLRTLLADFIADPADDLVQGAILRRLQINAEMVRRKRAADAEEQRRRRTGTGLSRIRHEPSVSSETSIMQEIAAEFRERLGLICECRSWFTWHAENFSSSEDEAVSWNDGCATCGHIEPVTVSHGDFHDTYYALVTVG